MEESKRIQNGTYYIQYFIDNGRDKNWAQLRHYIDVGEDYYSIDDYIITENYVAYEGAGWSGVDTNASEAGTQISKELYDRWVGMYEKAKKEIQNLASAAAHQRIDKIKAGDYLYLPYWLFMIGKDGEKLSNEIMISKYGLYYNDEKDDIDLDYEPGQAEAVEKEAKTISEEVYLRAKAIVLETAQTILEEIKANVKEIIDLRKKADV